MLKQCLVHRKSSINTGWNYHRIIAGDELLLQVSARRKCCKSQFMHLYRGTPYRILIKVKKIVYVKGLGQICCSINEYNKWVKWLEFLSSVNLQRYQVRACTRTQFYLTLCNPSTIARQAPLSMDFPGKNTGVGYHFLLQGTFPTQGSNSHFSSLLHWQLDFFFFYHCSIWEAWRYQGWASTLFCISNRRTELFLCQWLGFTDKQKMCLFHFGAECLQLITGTLMIQWWGWSLELIKRRPWPRLPQHWTPFLEIFLSAPWCQGAARTGSAVWADGSESGQDPLGS